MAKERLMNNFGFKLIAFIAAVILWFLVVNLDNPVDSKTFYNVPVFVINEEVLSEANKTYQITDGTQTVSVTVKAKRRELNRIQPENIVAIADLKELTLNTQVPISVSLNKYDDSYESISASPKNLQIQLEDEMTKKFPIVPSAKGTIKSGYVLGSLQAIPESVSIRGAESVISQIKRVEAPVDVSGISKNTELPSQLVLYDENDEKIDQALLTNNLGTEGTSVLVTVLPTKSVPVRFDFSQIMSEEEYNISGVSIEPKEVQVTGEPDRLQSTESIQVPASVLNYSGLTERKEVQVDISPYLPDGIKLADENAGTILVTISVEKDGTKTFDVTKGYIVAENLSDKLTLGYQNVDALVVKIKGPQEVLDTFDIENNVSIDLKDLKEAGEYTVPLKVNLPQRCQLEEEISVEIKLENKK